MKICCTVLPLSASNAPSSAGLEHIIPKLTEHGITTPKKLAQLNLRDMYEIGETTRLAR